MPSSGRDSFAAPYGAQNAFDLANRVADSGFVWTKDTTNYNTGLLKFNSAGTTRVRNFSTNESLYFDPTTPGSTDYSAQSNMDFAAVNAPPAGVVIAHDPTTNSHVRAVLDPAANRVRLYKRIAGADTLLNSFAPSPAFTTGAGFRIRVTRVGTSFSFFFNNTLQATAVVADAQVNGAGHPGIYSGTSGGVSDANGPQFVDFNWGTYDPQILVTWVEQPLTAGGATDTGTRKTGDVLYDKLRVQSIGLQDLAISSTTVTGNGTLVSAPSATLAWPATSDLIYSLNLGADATGLSAVATINSNDATNPAWRQTFLFDSRSNPTTPVLPGASWNGTAGSGGGVVTASTTAYGSGTWAARKIGAKLDTHFCHATDQSSLVVTAISETADPAWIRYVEFTFEGGSPVRVYTPNVDTTPSRTGCVGWAAKVTSAVDGDGDLYVRVVPVNGFERVIRTRLTFNPRGTIYTNKVSLTPANGDLGVYVNSLSAGTAASTIITLGAGTYTWAQSSPAAVHPTRPLRIRRDPNAAPNSVIINGGGKTQQIRIGQTKCQWENFYVEGSTYVLFGALTGNPDRDSQLALVCTFSDVNGVMGPATGANTTGALGYYVGDGSTGANAEANQTIMPGGMWGVEGCTFNQYSGPTGAVSVFASSITFGWDAHYNQDVSHVGRGNVVLTKSQQFNWRLSAANTVTVNTAIYNAGTNVTTITLSGSPSLNNFYSRFGPNYAQVVTKTGGVAVGTNMPLLTDGTGIDPTGFALKATGNFATLATNDTLFLYGPAHPDLNQFFAVNATSMEDFVDNRLIVNSPGLQPMLLQVPTGALEGVGSQLVLFNQTPASNGTQGYWQNGPLNNISYRQCSIGGTVISFTASAVNGCGVSDSLWTNLSTAAPYPTSGTPLAGPSTLYLSNTHTEATAQGVPAGGYSTGPASANLDPYMLHPAAGSPLLNRIYGRRLAWDVFLRPVPGDGTGAIGAVQPPASLGTMTASVGAVSNTLTIDQVLSASLGNYAAGTLGGAMSFLQQIAAGKCTAAAPTYILAAGSAFTFRTDGFMSDATPVAKAYRNGVLDAGFTFGTVTASGAGWVIPCTVPSVYAVFDNVELVLTGTRNTVAYDQTVAFLLVVALATTTNPVPSDVRQVNGLPATQGSNRSVTVTQRNVQVTQE